MKRRSIEDGEIALIKAMLSRRMPVTDIQFFFNRPGRKVNTGRITQIGNGTYSNAAEIPPASDDTLNGFLAQRSVDRIGAMDAPNTDAVAQRTIQRMFAKDEKGKWHLTAGETDRAECKESFGLKFPSKWLRAMAALANNRGGYIFFGVRDKDESSNHEVVGLSGDEWLKTDRAEIARRLRNTFNPTPQFQLTTIKVSRKTVGVIYVEQHPSRPVIATKNEGTEIREGDIFFRYPGTSSRVSYGDLRAMLDARDKQARADILPMVERLLALGPERAMVADLNDGRLMDGKHVIELDQAVIKGLTFIKEGEFTERAGAPALRLIGDVKAAAALAAPSVKKGLVTRTDMQQDFLNDRCQAEPLDYIRCAIEVSGSDWVPIRYFARAAGMSHAALLDYIDKAPAGLPAQKRLFKERLASSDKAFTKAAGPIAAMLARLSNGEAVSAQSVTEAREIALAMQAMTRPLKREPSEMRGLLLQCLAVITPSSDSFAKTAIRRAIARLDELITPLE